MSVSTKSQVNRFWHYSNYLLKYKDNIGVRATLTIILSVVLMSIFLIFAIKPTLMKIFELRTQIAESNKTLAKLTLKANTLTRIAQNWENISSKQIFLQNAIPLGPQYRTYNKEIGYLAQQTGVSILSLTLGKVLVYAEKVDPYLASSKLEMTPIPVTIRIGGSYDQLLTFLQQLVTIDRIMKLESITMTPDTMVGSTSKYALTMNITGTVYYMADTTLLSPFVDWAEKIQK
ncbi:MAG: type 4a pilus biogenesis protein PilO [bacterium]